MTLYRVGNHTLDSNMPLAGLAELPYGIAQHAFYFRTAREPQRHAFHWFHQWCGPDEEIWLLIAKHGSGYVLRFPDLADFYLSADVSQIECYAEPGTPVDTITHLLLDQVFPLVLSKRGHLVVHASAILTPVGVLAFVGSSGYGKSTLAASLALQGYPLMSDDCLVLAETESGLVASPSYPGARLWDDAIESLFERQPIVSDVAHYTDKKRLALNNEQVHFSSDCAPLHRMYYLSDPEETGEQPTISIRPLAAREAFVELVSYTYKLDVDDRNVLQREFRLLDRIAGLPLFYRLTYPRDFSMLPAVRQAILDHLHND